MCLVPAGREERGTTAHRRHRSAEISRDSQQHKTAQDGAVRQATEGQNHTARHTAQRSNALHNAQGNGTVDNTAQSVPVCVCWVVYNFLCRK